MKVTATGRTYGIKDDLKSWGFRWQGGAWVKECATLGEANLFRHNVSSGTWDGVDLEIDEAAP